MNLIPLWILLNGIAIMLGTVVLISSNKTFDPISLGWMLLVLGLLNCGLLVYLDSKCRGR